MNIQTIRTRVVPGRTRADVAGAMQPNSRCRVTAGRAGRWLPSKARRTVCCWSSWDDRDPSRKACALDDDRGNFGSRDHTTTDAVRVYARVAGGKVERLRVFSATCPVEAKTPIHDLGNVATDDSARWLIALSKRGADAASEQ